MQVAELTRARWRDQPQERGVTITLRTDLEPALPALMGAESEIRDALTNLVFNAVDAMPEGGSLALRTLAQRLGDPDPNSAEPTHVCVEVVDTGTGMDESTRQRCLEPFFTTKGERGTGLGLAMVYGMAQRHSAELTLTSEPGKGTTVRLVFPVAVGDGSTAVASSGPTFVGRLRILVVDDDPMLLKSLRDTLEGDGHVVTIADGGQQGVQKFLAAHGSGEPFAAVITDLGMPYFDGRRVASAIRAAAPHVPIILLTGWGERLLSDNDIPQDVDRVLAKPPRLHQLRGTLAELTTMRAESASPSRAQA
jgi:CheY-like chemotaxis protein